MQISFSASGDSTRYLSTLDTWRVCDFGSDSQSSMTLRHRSIMPESNHILELLNNPVQDLQDLQLHDFPFPHLLSSSFCWKQDIKVHLNLLQLPPLRVKHSSSTQPTNMYHHYVPPSNLPGAVRSLRSVPSLELPFHEGFVVCILSMQVVD